VVAQPVVEGAADSKPESDAAWHSFVGLEIAPHPGLTPAQAKAGVATIKVRRALLSYALRRLGLDVAPDVRPPLRNGISFL
jgi:hypothetical protein